MKRIKKWKEGRKICNLNLGQKLDASGWRLLLVSHGRLRPESARHRPTSEETEDRGQSGMWLKRLTELLDIFENVPFSDVTLSILIVIHHYGKNPLIVTAMQQIGLATFLRSVYNFLQTTRRHIPQD